LPNANVASVLPTPCQCFWPQQQQQNFSREAFFVFLMFFLQMFVLQNGKKKLRKQSKLEDEKIFTLLRNLGF
jgi:hypothetical protein